MHDSGFMAQGLWCGVQGWDTNMGLELGFRRMTDLLMIMHPSPPPGDEQAYVILYDVADLAGNRAATATRQVNVVCTTGEKTCTDDGGTLYCSLQGICIGQGVSTASSSQRSAALRSPPKIQLVGPSQLDVQSTYTYAKCGPLGGSCDGGAWAADNVDGNITGQVTVCGSKQRFVSVGLRPCNLNKAPGVVNITFTVVNSALLSASVTRYIRIVVTCLPGQVQCNSGGCSDGMCSFRM